MTRQESLLTSPRKLVAALAALAGLAGCGPMNKEVLPDSATACPAQVAQIGVADGMYQNLCGCTEAQGTVAPAPAELTCTVASGTSVLFYFNAPLLQHQVVSILADPPAASLSFPSSAIYDPRRGWEHPYHGVTLSTPGTYLFTDGYNGAMRGRVVVTAR